MWAEVLDFPAYRSWWPWLTDFDPPPLEQGAVARAVVRAPAGYRLRLDLTLVEVAAPHRVLIDVDGDVHGHATVAVVDRRQGRGDDAAGEAITEVTLSWALAPNRLLLRVLDLVARPVLVRGHDRILDDGLRRCLEATGLDLAAA